MIMYSESRYPVPTDIERLHAGEIASFAEVGTWGSAAQKTAVAAAARSAQCERGLQAPVDDERLTEPGNLPDAAHRLARAVAVDLRNIDRQFFTDTLANGVTEGAYVEIVSLVARLSNIDVFARGIDLPPEKLHKPTNDTQPSFNRPAEAVAEGFFAASVPSAPQGGELAESLYGKNPVGNIFRATSLVPDEARRVLNVGGVQYFGTDHLLDFNAVSIHPLSRAQIELVATKVSEHNQCFY